LHGNRQFFPQSEASTHCVPSVQSSEVVQDPKAPQLLSSQQPLVPSVVRSQKHAPKRPVPQTLNSPPGVKSWPAQTSVQTFPLPAVELMLEWGFSGPFPLGRQSNPPQH
jgi:hypothetical protein